MKTLTGQDLASELRGLCDGISRRLWIACPFVGDWSAVRRVLGIRWIEHGEISVRLITDDSVPACVNAETVQEFMDRGIVRLLKGLHAKVYIGDDQVLLSSANLTKTAFSKRHEVGVLLDESEAQDVIALFQYWWRSKAASVPEGWIDKTQTKVTRRTEQRRG